MRILVVDEKNLNRLIAEAMEDEGYSVDRCFNGLEAMEFMDCAKYDVMILDILMPQNERTGAGEKASRQGRQARRWCSSPRWTAWRTGWPVSTAAGIIIW
jgi:DNA-binding response OmpR family regulator